MLATVAMVVPSLNVLERMTVLPTFTGTSRMRPLMVDRMSVDEVLAFSADTPSRTTSRLSLAARSSSAACCHAFRFWSYSSPETRPLS